MKYSDFYGKLILLTNRNNITHAEIADCIGIERGAIFARANRNSKFKASEVEKLEEYFGVNLINLSIVDNSGEKIEKTTDFTKQSDSFGKRLYEHIQKKNNLSNREMAKLLGLYEDEYYDLTYGDLKPNLRVLNNIKQNFKVSIDYLLYGE